MKPHPRSLLRLAVRLAARRSPALAALAIMLMTGSAYAAIVALNDPSLPASLDGFNITRDTTTGLEWLDLDITLGRSFDDIVGNDGTNELAPGGDFAGFRYADRLEFNGTGSVLDIDGLIENFNLGQGVFSISAYAHAREYLSYLGCIGECGTYGFIQGMYVSELDPLNTDWAIVEALPSQGHAFGSMQISYDAPIVSRPVNGSTSLSGSFLVRSIPEPTTALLLGLGLATLAASGNRRSE